MRWDEYPTTMGRVVSVDVDASVAMVEVAGSEVPASLPDHLWYGTSGGLTVGPGAPVTLLRVLGGYQVVSSFTGADGAGAPTLGPELLANGGFESGVAGSLPTGWSAGWDWSTGESQPWQVASDSPLEGLQFARSRILPDYAHNAVFYRTLAARIDPGMTYNLSGFVRAAITGGTPIVSLEVLTGPTDADAAYFGTGGGTLQVVSTVASPGGAWPSFGGDFTVPAEHSYVRVSVRTTASDPAAPGTDASVDVDALSLRQRLA